MAPRMPEATGCRAVQPQEKMEALVPLYAMLKYGLEKPLTRGRANSKQNGETGKLPLPARCDIHFRILEEVLRTLSCP